MTLAEENLPETIARFGDDARRLESAIRETIVGQEQVVRESVIAVLCGGHVLLEGVPGLGKTLLVRSIAGALDLAFTRIQFTPDLMPADITGTMILSEDELGRRHFDFQKGPLFGNVVLADEVNRATPKTQSALLEAMQERTVTVGSDTRALPSPFFVMATQNPLEMEGTYPLPEAQLDRFLLKILVPFPTAEDLRRIARQGISPAEDVLPVLDGAALGAMIEAAREVPVATAVLDYAVSLLLATHPNSTSIELVRHFVRAGASPRGLQALVSASQVRALIGGRYNVAVDDIQALAAPTLRHRVLLTFEGQAEGMSTDDVIAEIVDHLPVP